MVALSDEEQDFLWTWRLLDARDRAMLRAVMAHLLKLHGDSSSISGRWQIDECELTDPDRALIRDIASASQSWTEAELITVRCSLGDRPPGYVEKFLRGVAQQPLPAAG